MHPNPIFRKQQTSENVKFARERGFGVLAVNAEPGPLLSHIPFLVSPSGEYAEFHLVRSNPITGLTKGVVQACLAVQGPHSYVSPDWYGIDDQVPTWNYVAVHLRGSLEQLPAHMLRDLLDRQSEFYETRLLPKPIWSSAKMTPDVLERMMRQIVPVRLNIETVTGTWKLAQNKAEAARLSAAEAIQTDGIGDDLGLLSELMRNPPA